MARARSTMLRSIPIITCCGWCDVKWTYLSECVNVFSVYLGFCSLPQRATLNPFHIVKICCFCMMEGNTFHLQGSFYKQENRAPTGSPLSPVLAEVFTWYFERRLFSHTSTEVTPVGYTVETRLSEVIVARGGSDNENFR
ncbi:hypothetical protein M514_23161 [Trichuris suis]|uniref:Reverse transcriptase domain-containing protein n=1 Tax=Trichuris suis TaxID=68888 RepID=A0A085N5F7_9BILA|nr:hypothetical protein M514_23161 [Trichuris suis]